ncbi:MAG: type II toxin-antitoxin system HicA family toxin [Verrucomicrobiota bacterium]
MPYKAREALARLQRAGFVIKRLAMHPGDIPTGTFRSILKQSGLTEEEFRDM